MTLSALRKKLYPVEGIMQFIDDINVSRSGNENIVEMEKF